MIDFLSVNVFLRGADVRLPTVSRVPVQTSTSDLIVPISLE